MLGWDGVSLTRRRVATHVIVRDEKVNRFGRLRRRQLTPIVAKPRRWWSEGQIARVLPYCRLLGLNAVGCRAAGQHLALGVFRNMLLIVPSDDR